MTPSNAPVAAVLLADSEVGALEATKSRLENHHYQVCVAQDEQQVIDMIPKIQPALVLLGSNVAGKTGLEVCRAIKQRVAPGFLPVILLSDANSNGIAPDGEFEADDFLVKPVKEADMMMRVGSLLRLKRQHDALWKQNQSLSAELATRAADLERALRESREASLLRDSIVKNVSHELRTPLLQIKSSVAMLAEDARAASPNGISALADHATAATARLESVVQNITQLAASASVKLEPFRLLDAVNIAVRQLGRQWASSGAVDRIKITLDDVPLVLGDRGGVAQVLQQLIDNGIKFSPKGGNVEISAEIQEKTVRVVVRDHGIGIAEDQRGRIFQAFYQVDSSTTRPFGGAGVGLAIVKLILDKMDTVINVESEQGVGSTFSFVLPKAQTEEPSAGAAKI